MGKTDSPNDIVLPFSELRTAGRHLAVALDEYSARPDVVVLTPVLGGLPVALEVANQLYLPLDVIIIRRVLVPRGYGTQICAVNVAGTLVIDDELPPQPAVPETGFDHFVRDALDALARRERVCRGGRPPMELAGRTVLLVDCGIHTGLTMRAAISALRTRELARIVAAVPVAAIESRAEMEAAADEVVCLHWPGVFGHTGLWYADFKRPEDQQVSDLLTSSVSPPPVDPRL